MSNIVSRNRQRLIDVHVESEYYENAESWNTFFWNKSSLPRILFERLDLSKTVDLACGHGRHTQQIIDHVGSVMMVDTCETNLDACRKRFSSRANVSYYQTSGNELNGLETAAYTSLFSYDAMVHFESLDVIDYLREISRVLRPGGFALLHYSNLDSYPAKTFHENVHWRNFFSTKMMVHFATRFSFDVIENRLIDWPPEGGACQILTGLCY